jgi:hypothetical protein
VLLSRLFDIVAHCDHPPNSRNEDRETKQISGGTHIAGIEEFRAVPCRGTFLMRGYDRNRQPVIQGPNMHKGCV